MDGRMHSSLEFREERGLLALDPEPEYTVACGTHTGWIERRRGRRGGWSGGRALCAHVARLSYQDVP